MSSGPGVGVVVALYDQVQPGHLRASLQGLVEQTLPPEEVWLVMDGPVTPQLEEVASSFEGRLPIRVLRLAERSGAGPARQAAVNVATTEFLAIADADDVSVSHRLARQQQVMVSSSLDLLGSAMLQFGTGVRGTAIRGAVVGEAGIHRRLRSNNPFNHPTVMFRTSFARAVGGYRDLPFLEDYDLVARMIAAGARTDNLDEPLVRFRLDDATLRRRSTWAAAVSEYALQRRLVGLGLVSRRRAAANFVVRNGYRVLPLSAQRTVNERVLSRSGQEPSA